MRAAMALGLHARDRHVLFRNKQFVVCEGLKAKQWDMFISSTWKRCRTRTLWMLKKKEQERVQLAVVPACSRTSHVPFLPKSTLLFSVKKKSTPVAPPWLSVVQWLWWIGLGVVPERLSQPRPNGLDSSLSNTVTEDPIPVKIA